MISLCVLCELCGSELRARKRARACTPKFVHCLTAGNGGVKPPCQAPIAETAEGAESAEMKSDDLSLRSLRALRFGAAGAEAEAGAEAGPGPYHLPPPSVGRGSMGTPLRRTS